jgi:hypothetical protein
MYENSFKTSKQEPQYMIPTKVWQEVQISFAMGHHKRIGKSSVLQMLSSELIHFILEQF